MIPQPTFELAVYNENQDTLKYVTGADVYAINGTAINGVHFDINSQTVNFKPGTPGYVNYKKVKLNLIPDSFFYGTRFFTIGLRNITGILKSQLNYGLDTLRIIIDYDGKKLDTLPFQLPITNYILTLQEKRFTSKV
jgi:hypothetical protein